MTIEYNVSQEGLRIETYPKGLLNIKETIDYFESLKKDERIKPGAMEIVYFGYVTDFQISYSDSEIITRRYQDPKSKQMIEATIFVCETNLAYGIGRMLQALHEIANPNHHVEVVRSRQELENFLQKVKP